MNVLVNSLRVRNVGPIKDATLPAAPVTLFLGPNEMGKTTLLRALYIQRFGTIPGLDVKDNADLTHEGAGDGWSIESDLDGLKVKATRSSRPLAADFEKVLGDARVFRALIDCQRFLTLESHERKALVADLVAADTASLAELLESEGADPKVVAAVRAGLMTKAFAIAEENRRAQDRILKELEARASAPIEDPEVETKGGKKRISTINLVAIDGVLEGIRRRRDKALEVKHARAQHAEILEDAAKAEKELKPLVASTPWEPKNDRRLLAIQKELDEIRMKVQSARARREAALKVADELGVLLKKGGSCPTCKSEIGGAVESAVQTTKHREESVAIAARDEQEREAAKLKPLEDEQKDLNTKKQACDRMATLKGRLQERIDRAKDIDAPPDVDEDNDPSTLALEILRIEKMRDARKAYDVAGQLREEAKGEIQGRTERRDGLARFEELTRPGQVAGEAEVIQELNSYIDEAAKALFPGEPAAVLVTAGWDVLVHHRKLPHASTSALLRAGFACAIALSRLSKLGLLFLDQVEAIDDKNRSGVMGLLKKAIDDGWLRNAYLAAVKQDPKPSAQVPWLAWVLVKDGTATVLK